MAEAQSIFIELTEEWLLEKSLAFPGEHIKDVLSFKKCVDIHKILAYKLRGFTETRKSVHESSINQFMKNSLN